MRAEIVRVCEKKPVGFKEESFNCSDHAAEVPITLKRFGNKCVAGSMRAS